MRESDVATIDAVRPSDEVPTIDLPDPSLLLHEIGRGDTPPVDGLAQPLPANDRPRARRVKERFGHFNVLGTLGSGGMGTVLRAYDETLQRLVALKLLHRRLRGQQRLLREAQTLAQLSHPNVVQVYEMGMVDDQLFIAMELVDGEPLRTWQQTSRSWSEIVDVYLQAGRGLAAAHAEGIIHRDVKPENIIMGTDGRVRVLDFGLARAVEFDSNAIAVTNRRYHRADTESRSKKRMTQSGTVVGTLCYLPLLQLWGMSADTKSDQYSYCVSLYEALYGVRPHADDTLTDLIDALENEKLQPVPGGHRVPNRVRKIVLRGLAKHPDDRFETMDALLEALEHARRPRRHWAYALALAMVAGSSASATVLLGGSDPCRSPETGLQGTWGRDDREALRAAFSGSGHADAQGSFERVSDRLDAYVRDWVAMADQSCHATFEHQQQSEELFDRRMQCLQRQRGRLQLAIDSLADVGSPQQLVDRMPLAFKLPPLGPCADVDVLMAQQAPADPAVREQMDSLRTQLDRATTLSDAGEVARGVELAHATVVEARELGETMVLAESLERLGLLQTLSGKGSAAEETLNEAIDVAAEAKADRVAARAWAHLIYSLLVKGQLDQGVTLERAARAAVTRADDDIAKGWLLNNLGALYGERHEFERARDYLTEALGIKQQTLGPGHMDVGIAWFNLGNAMHKHGHPDDALVAYGRARMIFDATVGPTHPHSAFVATGMGHLLRERGEIIAAIEQHRRALEIREAVFGPNARLVARTLRYLGEAEFDARRFSEAREHLARAMAVYELSLGIDNANTLETLVALARSELGDDRPDTAAEHARRAVDAIERTPQAAELRPRARFVLALARWEQGEHAEARALAEEILDQEPGSAYAEVERWLAERPDPATPTEPTAAIAEATPSTATSAR